MPKRRDAPHHRVHGDRSQAGAANIVQKVPRGNGNPVDRRGPAESVHQVKSNGAQGKRIEERNNNRPSTHAPQFG